MDWERYHASMHLIISLLFILACQNDLEPAHRQLMASLSDIEKNPSNGIVHCSTIDSTEFKDECLLIALGRLLPNDVDEAKKICSSLSENNVSECYFRLAEASRNIGDCHQAGDYEIDCKLHLLSGALSRGMPGGKNALQLFKLPTDSPAGWTAIYRQKLQFSRIIDRSQCQKALYKKRCMEAGISLFKERIERAKSLDSIPCLAQKLQDHLNPGDDELLKDLIQRERKPCR